MRTIILILLFNVMANFVAGQQDAQYTQYMYHTSSVNPAYSGSRDVLSITGLHRSQWV
ncbi:MAG TPA: type IX secretion system membrane protein PorP/SprF, partial [Mariniflexile sp.]